MSNSNSDNITPQEFTDYLSQVCQQIRWKKAHPSIRQELSNHMKDQMEAYISHGIPFEDAIQKTILEMGDPIQIGTQLDRTYRPKIDKGILLLAGLLLLTGFFMQSVFYAQSPIPFPWLNMVFAVVLGVCGMLAAVQIDYTILAMKRKTSIIIYLLYNFVTLFLLIHYRFIRQAQNYMLYSFAVYLSLLFPLILCGLIYSFRNQGLFGFLICGGMTMISLFLLQGSTFFRGLIISFVCLAVLILALKINWFGNFSRNKKMAAYALMFCPTIILFCAFLIQAWPRISASLNPYIDPRNQGYYTLAVRSALASSKWIGPAGPLSLPFSQRQHSLTEVLPHTTDLLLTWVIASLGWWSLCIILLPALLLCWKGIRICQRQSSTLGKMVSFSVVTTLAIQFFFFLLANLGGFAFSAFPFPFVQGNVSIIVNFILLGFLLSAEQRKGLEELDFSQMELKPLVGVSVQRSSREINISLKFSLPSFKHISKK